MDDGKTWFESLDEKDYVVVNMTNLSSEEINCLYRCISIAMDWRDAVDNAIVEDVVGRDWLTYNIDTALIATNKLAYKDTKNDN
jgi:hypothetical protein